MTRIEAIVASNVRQIRIAQELTQSMVAEGTGMSLAAVSRIEQGGFSKHGVGLLAIERIADYLGVPLYLLFMTRAETMSPKRVGAGRRAAA